MKVSEDEKKVIQEIIHDFLLVALAMKSRGDLERHINRKLNVLRMVLTEKPIELDDFQKEVLFEIMCFALDRLTLMETFGDLSEQGREKLAEKRTIMTRLINDLQEPEKHSRLQFVAQSIFLAPAELVRMGLLCLIPEQQRLVLLNRYQTDSSKGRLSWIAHFFYTLLVHRTH